MRKTFPTRTKENLIKIWDSRCAYCGCQIDIKSCQIDHGVPLYLQDQINKLGENANLPFTDLNDMQNLFPACKQCNNWKGGYTIAAFEKEIAKQIERCEKYSRNFRIARRFGMILTQDCKGLRIRHEKYAVDSRIIEFNLYKSLNAANGVSV